jgi:hypothetical protein
MYKAMAPPRGGVGSVLEKIVIAKDAGFDLADAR